MTTTKNKEYGNKIKELNGQMKDNKTDFYLYERLAMYL